MPQRDHFDTDLPTTTAEDVRQPLPDPAPQTTDVPVALSASGSGTPGTPPDTAAAPAPKPPRRAFGPDDDAVAATLRRRLTKPISPRHLRLTAAAAALTAIVFTTGWAVGARDPLLAPVQLSPAPEAAGPSTAERVYSVVKDSVVTLHSGSGTTGTGFFYRPDRIVTNHHVVATADALRVMAEGGRPKVEITLADGRVRIGEVLAVDARLDLAIIEAPDGLGVRPLAFADSARVQPGEPAIVVGSPFGLGTSVSAGIISGRDRSTQFSADPVQNELIQTDAAVNPGNSGGPLLTETATVAGIVTLRPDEANGRSAQGIAFALPSKAVVAAIDQLERYGQVSHPQLGVFLESAEETSGARSVVVTKVAPGSPADQAGVRAGDRIRAVDTRESRIPNDVIDALTGKRAGDTVTLTLRRGTQRVNAEVTLRERPTGR